MTGSRPEGGTEAGAPSTVRVFTPMMATAVILCSAAILAINNRIFSLISGFDPMIYIRIARSMLADGITPSSLLEGGSLTAPGFPLILAAVIKIFGPTAPYWINPLIALALLPLLAIVLVRAGVPARQAAIALPAALLLLFSGYRLNAHFLLYPFRELSAFAVSLAGVWMLFAAARNDSAFRRSLILAAGAGVCAMATALIREPTVLGIAGAVVWYAASRRPWKTKGAVLACFLAPFVLAILAYLALARGHAPNAQWAKWIGEIAQSGGAAMFSRFATIEPTVRWWFIQEMGWFWSAMLLAGMWSLRRTPRAVVTFMLPAVLLHLFYSFTEAHRRYLLSSLLYVAPVAGCGLGWIAEAVAARLPDRKRWVPAIPHALAIGVVAAFMVAATVKLTPAGPRVKWPQIEKAMLTLSRAADEQASTFANPGRLRRDQVTILTTPCSRYGGDFVSSFSNARAADISNIGKSRLMHESWLVLAAVNSEAMFRGGYRAYFGVSADAIAAHYADLEPACGSDLKASSFGLGHGLYTIYRTRPLAGTNSVCAVTLATDSTNINVVWLDFRHNDPAPDTVVAVAGTDNTAEIPFATVKAHGWQPVILPPLPPTNRVVLRMAASGPIPTNIAAGVQTGEGTAQFTLTTQRSPSTHDWLKRPFRTMAYTDDYAALMDEDGGRIEIPMPAAQTDLTVHLTLVVAGSRKSTTSSSFQVSHDSTVVGTMDLHAGQGEQSFTFRIGGVKASRVLAVDIRSTTPDSRSVWRIRMVGLRIQPVVPQ